LLLHHRIITSSHPVHTLRGISNRIAFSMEGPIDEEALPTEFERDNATTPRRTSGTLRYEVGKRSYSWLLAPAAMATLPWPSPPQDEDIPGAKRRRLMTREVEATNQEKKHYSYQEHRKEGPAVATMAPVLTNRQVSGLSRWHPSTFPTTGFTGVSIADQVNLLQMLDGMNGYTDTAAPGSGQTTSVLTGDQLNLLQILHSMNGYSGAVTPGLAQTTSPCWNGWSSRDRAWDPTIAQAAGLIGQTGMHTADQAYASLARGQYQATTGPRWNGSSSRESLTGMRTADQNCILEAPVDQASGGSSRWTTAEAGIDWTSERKGKWTAEEDRMLLHAAEKFAATRWKTIAGLIPGRTKKQCWNRWQYALDPSIVQTTERTGKWLTEEDDELVAGVQKYNGKNWDATAALVPSRTKRQCMDRWHKVLAPSVG
jgi:hypothetical protein